MLRVWTYSVEESGLKRGVNWVMGYIIVFPLVSVVREVEATGLTRGSKTDVDAEMYFLGSRRGEGARFEDGHSKIYPAGSWRSGVTRKLRLHTAAWILWK